MNARFSHRMGIEKLETTIQTDSINDTLRSALWNCLLFHVWHRAEFARTTQEEDRTLDLFSSLFYANYLRRPADEKPGGVEAQFKDHRGYFFSASWNHVYDYIEWVLSLPLPNVGKLAECLNEALERELSGFRIIDKTITPIISPSEVDAVDTALSQPDITGAKNHLAQSLKLLSDRSKPDYRNSLKESISAVESTVQKLTGLKNQDLSDALAELSRSIKLHPAFQKGISSLYGYTSDEEGIRHSMQDEPDLGQEDAIFFLVSCSALVNYLISKYGEYS